MADYSRWDVADALHAVGVESGDVVFSHVSAPPLGEPEAGLSEEGVVQTLLWGYGRALGTGGTLAVPTFTYSATSGEAFDPASTPSDMGMFSEAVRKLPESHRSHDPIFSVAAHGPDAENLTHDVSRECFGPDSFWARLHGYGGKIVNVNHDAGSTFLHYVERMVGVDYRTDRTFRGTLVTDGEAREVEAIYHSRDLENPHTVSDFTAFDELARKRGLVRTARLGRGEVVAITCKDAFRLVAENIRERPELLVNGTEEAA